MPDITMCGGAGCERRDTCYRHTAHGSPYRQSFFTQPPVKPDGSCDYYAPNARATPTKETDVR